MQCSLGNCIASLLAEDQHCYGYLSIFTYPFVRDEQFSLQQLDKTTSTLDETFWVHIPSLGLTEVYTKKDGHFVKLLLSFVITGKWLDGSPMFILYPVSASAIDKHTLSLKSELTMNQPIELSLEQQFSIRSFESQVENMSREQAQHFLVKLYEQMVMREATYKHLLKHQWGLEPNPQE